MVLTRVGLRLTEELAERKQLDRWGRPLSASNRPERPQGVDPRAPRSAEITGWIEPSSVDPLWLLNIHVEEGGFVQVDLTRGRGLVVQALYSGSLGPGDYQLVIGGLDYQQLRQNGNFFLTLISGDTVQKVKIQH